MEIRNWKLEIGNWKLEIGNNDGSKFKVIMTYAFDYFMWSSEMSPRFGGRISRSDSADFVPMRIGTQSAIPQMRRSS